jgi:hypothetical protein
MNDDELRRALDRYAAAAPDTDPRPALDARLARRSRMRAVAGVAAAAAFVAGTGVAVVLDRDRPADVLVTAEPSETATPGADPATPSPSPTSSASASPSPAESAQPMPPASRPSTPSSPPAQTSEPRRPPVTATAEGAYGLRVRITLDPGDPDAGDTARLVAEVTDDDGSMDTVSLDWGDGTGESVLVTAQCAPDPPLGQRRDPQPVDVTQTYSHAWRNPGEMRVTFHVRSRLQCQDEPAPEEATATLVAHVRPGSVSSNGPAAPAIRNVTTQPASEGGPYEVELGASASDADGYVGAVVVDWGDGTSDTYGNEMACGDGDGRHYPDAPGVELLRTHDYRRSGTFTITLRVASTGCGGRDPQRTSATTVAKL